MIPQVDPARLARECLKNLTAEDFMQMSQMEGPSMLLYEKRYVAHQGNAAENELAKIILRYQNEGKPSGIGGRKQVTFQEGRTSAVGGYSHSGTFQENRV